MVESVYRHNKTWQFSRWPCHTFGPYTHCLPCLFSFPREQYGRHLSTQMDLWSSLKIDYQCAETESFDATCCNILDYIYHCNIGVSHLLLHGVGAHKGSQIHRDITYYKALQTSLAHTHADRVQGLWVYRGLRNSRAYSFQLTAAM